MSDAVWPLPCAVQWGQTGPASDIHNNFAPVTHFSLLTSHFQLLTSHHCPTGRADSAPCISISPTQQPQMTPKSLGKTEIICEDILRVVPSHTCVSPALLSSLPDSCLVRLSYFCSPWWISCTLQHIASLKTTAINTQKWPYERNIRLIHGWEWVWVSDVKGGAHWVGNSCGNSFHFIILWHSQ